MLFEVHDLNKDVLEITVFDKDLFSPNGKLSDKSRFQTSIYLHNKTT